MEENIARIDEVEELDTINESEDTSENSAAGAFVAGIVGGFLGYAIISGGKKLVAFAGAKIKERKNRKVSNGVVLDAEIVDEKSEDVNPEKKS